MEEDFMRATRRSIADIHSLLIKITSRELCLRAAVLALLEQPQLDRRRLVEDFEANLLRVLEQVPPHLRDAEVFATFEAELQDRLRPQPDPRFGASD